MTNALRGNSTMLRLVARALAALSALAMSGVARAQDAAAFVPTAEMVNKGDVAWMLVASALVLMMSVPALALFYGGLVRTKNMLSGPMQGLTIVCVAAMLWFGWGPFMALTPHGSPLSQDRWRTRQGLSGRC